MNENNPYSAPKNDPHAHMESAQLPRDILLEGSMSIQDVLRTQVLILRRRWPYAVLTLGIYIAFVLTLGLFTPNDALFGNTFMLLGLVIMPAILPFTLFMIFLRLKRDAKLKIGIFAATETRLTTNGIQTSKGEGQASVPWSSFSRFLCSEHVVLLFLKAVSYTHLTLPTKRIV